jgi:peptidoglycan/xylan/chitin deacetylase (PgdA/CDA1 family)
LLRRLKLLTLNAADHTGLFALMANSRWRRNRLVILCYHGVSLRDEHEWSDVHITEERLARRFETLRELGCALLPLAEAIERLKVGELEEPSVVVTFDEGLYDFYAKAYPLLKTFGIPSTLYVPTYYSTFQRPIFDLACSYFLWRGRGRMIEAGRLLSGAPRVRIPLAPAARNEMHLNMRAHVYTAGFTAVEKDVMLGDLSEQVGVDWDEFVASRSLQLMSPAELSSLDTALVDVQLHTHRHRTPRSEPMFAREVNDNIEALAAMGFPRAGRRHFCYPSGDADPAFFPWLEALGIASATTCEPAYVTRTTPLLNLPRVVDTMAVTDVEFRAWITGVARLLPRRRYRRHSDVELGTDVWTKVPEREPKVIPIRDHVRPHGATATDREVPLSLAPRLDRPSPRAASDGLVFRQREPRRADP